MTLDEVKTRILEMAEQDQAGRRVPEIDWSKQLPIDKANCEVMKQIVAEHGWLSISLVGPEISNKAWLMVQHFTFDIDFQKHCLNLMKSLPEGEVNVKNIAYLTDQVMVQTTGIQRYGTQLVKKDGVLLLRPLEDTENIDKIRAQVGLNPLREYLAYWDDKGGAYLSEEEYLKSKPH